MIRHPRLTAFTLALTHVLLFAPAAFAGETTGALPWNEPLHKIKESITGPTATGLILIAIVVALATWSLSDDNRGLMRSAKAVAAIAVVAALIPFLSLLGIDAATL